MNWLQIENKSWNALEKWLSKQYTEHFMRITCDKHTLYVKFFIGEDMPVNPRVLYDFFDEHGIYIEVMMQAFAVSWGYSITCPPRNEWIPERSYDSRPSAEEAAFTKAFGILEEKLKA